MVHISHVEFDVMKPMEELPVSQLLGKLASLKGVEKVSMEVKGISKSLKEKADHVIIKLKGEELNLDEIERIIEKLGATVHSVDKIEAHSK